MMGDKAYVEDDDLILLLSDGVTKAFSILEASAMILDKYERTGSCATDINELAELLHRGESSDDDITDLAIVI